MTQRGTGCGSGSPEIPIFDLKCSLTTWAIWFGSVVNVFVSPQMIELISLSSDPLRTDLMAACGSTVHLAERGVNDLIWLSQTRRLLFLSLMTVCFQSSHFSDITGRTVGWNLAKSGSLGLSLCQIPNSKELDLSVSALRIKKRALRRCLHEFLVFLSWLETVFLSPRLVAWRAVPTSIWVN